MMYNEDPFPPYPFADVGGFNVQRPPGVYAPLYYTPEAFYGLTGYIRAPSVFGPHGVVTSELSAPRFCQSEKSGSRKVGFMSPNCDPGTAIGVQCCPESPIEVTTCVGSSLSTGTSNGIRRCVSS